MFRNERAEEDLRSRKGSIGYYPGGKAELISTLTAYIAFFEAPRTREEVEAFSTANYGIKPSCSSSHKDKAQGEAS